jgi:hypothetical protein
MLTTGYTKVVSVNIYRLNESGDLGAISGLCITLLLTTSGGKGVSASYRERAPDTTADESQH